ncbi:MAG: cyanophycin synthetase [Acidobacteriota bacterium]
MKILDSSVYVGPNRYALFPIIRMQLDLGPLEDYPSGALGDAFVDGLLEALPGLHQHGCSYGEPGGFVRRMTEDEGTWIGHIFEHVAIELQDIAGSPVTFGRTRGDGPRGHYRMIYAYENADVGLAAGHLGRDLLLHLLPDDVGAAVRAWRAEDPAEEDAPPLPETFDFPTARDAFIRYAQRRALGPSTAALVRAAEGRDIPWQRLNNQSLIQFGHGRHGRRIQATITSQTAHIAVEIASDKEETNRILADLGLPVPEQRCVDAVDDALWAAERIGYPVVIKPLDANHGRGVTIGVADADGTRAAFEAAQRHSEDVLIEAQIVGFDHRLLVIDGRLVAAAKRVPGHVVGDGHHTLAALVELVNADPRRGIGHEKVLTQLVFDRQAERLMAAAGYAQDTVLPAGEVFYLRATANLSTGGTAIDVTDVVHPDNREMAERAAKAIGLDICGVDFLTVDITRSYREIGGAICEINAAPGFRMHVSPSEGPSRDVAGPVIDMLFPPDAPSRIPIASITGTNGKTTTVRMVAHLFKMAGQTVGLTTTDGVYIDGRLTVEGDLTGPVAASMVLRDPEVEVAVLETARGGMVKRGVGYRHCTVGAVLNVQADHLGLRGIDTLDEMAEIKRIVVEIARDTAVLNADDARCLQMAAHTDASHLCYVTMNPKHDLVRTHIRAGGRAMVLEDGINGQMITLFDRGAHMPLLWTHQIPATLDGKAMHNVQNAMFAAAVAHSMGLGLDAIRQGLRTFDTTFFQAPGRMNVYDGHAFKVILDYGHNPAAVQAMVDVATALEVDGRRICVLAAPGDRRDEDIDEIARIAANRFDHVLCRRDDDLRDRGPSEIPERLARVLREEGMADDAISIVPDEQEAIDAALSMAEPHDLVLIFADTLRRSWDQIKHFGSPAGRPGEDEPEPAVVVPTAETFEDGVRLPPPSASSMTLRVDDVEPPSAPAASGLAPIIQTLASPSGAAETTAQDWVHDPRGVYLAARSEPSD